MDLRGKAKELFFIAILFVGSLGIYLLSFQLFVLILLAIFSFWIFLKRKGVSIPKYFVLYLFFLLVMQVHALTIGNNLESLSFFLTYLIGGIFYLFFANKRYNNGFIGRLILSLGFLLGIAYFVNTYVLHGTIYEWSLFSSTSLYKNHNHIGDLWSMVLIVAVYLGISKKRNYYFLFLIPGLYFLLISLSRSAYLSLLVGLLIIILKTRLSVKKWIGPMLIFAVLLFFYAGYFKTTLYARPYYVQAIAGFLDHPNGVGIGRFGTISSNSKYWLFGMSGFSFYTHDILLEFLSGMGFYGTVFIIFYFLSLIRALSRNVFVLQQALFASLSVNFLFDTTYFVPSMVWIWFILLGQIMGQSKKTS